MCHIWEITVFWVYHVSKHPCAQVLSFPFVFLSVLFSVLSFFSSLPFPVPFSSFLDRRIFDFVGFLLRETQMLWVRQFSHDLYKYHATIVFTKTARLSFLFYKWSNHLSRMFGVSWWGRLEFPSPGAGLWSPLWGIHHVNAFLKGSTCLIKHTFQGTVRASVGFPTEPICFCFTEFMRIDEMIMLFHVY